MAFNAAIPKVTKVSQTPTNFVSLPPDNQKIITLKRKPYLIGARKRFGTAYIQNPTKSRIEIAVY
jgi:hypothetical protein